MIKAFWAIALMVLSLGCETGSEREHQSTPSSDQLGLSADGLDFKAVSIGVPAETKISFGETGSYSITGHESDLERIEVEVKKGWLKVRSNGRKPFKKRVEVIITAKGLEGIKQEGSGIITCEDGVLAAQESTLIVSGSGAITASTRGSQILKGVLTGSGKLELSGNTDMLDVSISGSGDINARSLVAESVNVVISGSGTCEVEARESLNAVISGSGNLSYLGDPKVTTMINGSGEVLQLK